MDEAIVCKPTFFQTVNQHFSRLSGRHSTCSKLLDLLAPFNMGFEVPKKILVIFVHQGAAKLPVFLHQNWKIYYTERFF